MRGFLVVLALAVVSSGCISNLNLKPASTADSLAAAVYKQDCAIRTADWNDTCTARASHIDKGWQQEISTAVNPMDPGNVIIGSKEVGTDASENCVWNGLAVTKDGGKTWKDVHIGGDKFADRQPGSPYYGYACNTDPDVAFGPDGTAYYAVEMYNLGGPDSGGLLGVTKLYTHYEAIANVGSEFVLATSHDGGLTWPDSVVMDLGDGVVAFHDYSRLTVNPVTKTVLLAFGTYDTPGTLTLLAPTTPPASGVFISVVTSTDGGKTANKPVIVTGSPQNQDFGEYNIGDIAVSPDGKTVSLDAEGFDGNYYLFQSRDDGQTWSAPAKMFKVNGLNGVPNVKFRAGSGTEIVYDHGANSPWKGALYEVHAENVSGHGDIWFEKSMDNGKTWAPPVTVNDDATACTTAAVTCYPNHDHWMSNVAVTDDGAIHVFFMDRRWDAANRLIDLTYAVSTDGGKTFVNHRVTSQSFDGDLGKHQDGFPFIGDYLGLDSSGNTVWAGFPDSIIGRTVIAAAEFTK
ncbi:MAG: sialidase family protein [Thermoplasmatota archaeon]